MQAIRTVWNAKPFFWLLLTIPAIAPLIGYFGGSLSAHDMVYPLGEWGARWLILALIVGPLATIFRRAKWAKWLVQRRRALGVMAFGYGLVHLVFYAIDKGTLNTILDELPEIGIWTGWVAVLLMLPLALTSNDTSVRVMRAAWKKLHLLAYPAFVFVMAHWALIGDFGALVWAVPVITLQAWGFLIRKR